MAAAVRAGRLLDQRRGHGAAVRLARGRHGAGHGRRRAGQPGPGRVLRGRRVHDRHPDHPFRVRLLGRGPAGSAGYRGGRAGGRDAGAADPVALPGHRHPRPGRRVCGLDHQLAGHRRRLRHLRDPDAPAVRHRPDQPVPVLLPGASRAGRRAGVRAVRGAHAAGPADAGDAGRRAGRERVGGRDRRAADDRLRAGQRVRRRGRGALRRAHPLRRAGDVQHRQHVPAAGHGHHRRAAVAGRLRDRGHRADRRPAGTGQPGGTRAARVRPGGRAGGGVRADRPGGDTSPGLRLARAAAFGALDVAGTLPAVRAFCRFRLRGAPGGIRSGQTVPRGHGGGRRSR